MSRSINPILALLFTVVLLLSCATAPLTYTPSPTYHYPAAPRCSASTTYHTLTVSDPYRWLEDLHSPQTRSWIEQQNQLTAQFFAGLSTERIQTRLRQLYDYPRMSTPFKQAGCYFFWKNTGLQNQSVLYIQRSLTAAAEPLLNPNLLSKDGTVAVTATAVSHNAEFLAYALSYSGSDTQQVKIRRTDTQEDLPDILRWCRFTTIAWKHDNTGFFYNRFPDPATVAPEDQTNYNRLYFHTLSTPQSDDILVYDDPENKELMFVPTVTEDGRFLVLSVYHGTDTRNRIYYRPIDDTGPFVKLLDAADARYDFLGNIGSTFYFNTDLDAPRGRIIAIDIHNSSPDAWRTIIPQNDDIIDHAALLGNHLVLTYMHHVCHQLKIFTPDGTYLRSIPLPALGTVTGLSGHADDPETFFSFTSYLHPPVCYRYNLQTHQLSTFHKPDLPFPFHQYQTTRHFYRSKDGTRIPIFITHRKNLPLDGDNPTLLYGYGGFNISIRPSFSPHILYWLENGGVYAVANIRGGGEYGQTWHSAGMLHNKQNVFDDFIAAARFLIETGYTNPNKLAVTGRSNGGLLVAATMLQRPDLFGAVVCQVPVTDMLRYYKFTVGRYWIPEYGNPETSPEMFKTLYAYSPLHNVQPGRCYPPVLVTTADTDDRVVPAHAYKFIATLQAQAAPCNPILLRIETKAGHGHGKPIAKRIAEQADIYAFLLHCLAND